MRGRVQSHLTIFNKDWLNSELLNTFFALRALISTKEKPLCSVVIPLSTGHRPKENIFMSLCPQCKRSGQREGCSDPFIYSSLQGPRGTGRAEGEVTADHEEPVAAAWAVRAEKGLQPQAPELCRAPLTNIFGEEVVKWRKEGAVGRSLCMEEIGSIRANVLLTYLASKVKFCLHSGQSVCSLLTSIYALEQSEAPLSVHSRLSRSLFYVELPVHFLCSILSLRLFHFN